MMAGYDAYKLQEADYKNMPCFTNHAGQLILPHSLRIVCKNQGLASAFCFPTGPVYGLCTAGLCILPTR